MVTREDVVAAYRLILGREPENEDVVTAHLSNTATIAELRQRFFSSPEFTQGTTSEILVGRHYYGSPMSIDEQINAATLEEIFLRTGKVWQTYGTQEPYWSVLTLPQFKMSTVNDSAIESFYRTGNDSFQVVQAFFQRSHIDMRQVHEVLEFGCGVGRTTFALAQAFSSVLAVDISGQHLALASQRQSDLGVRNVQFKKVDSLKRLEELKAVDLFYSVIVLQHNPPPVISAILSTLLGKVRAGGFALFQVPTYRSEYSFDARSYLNETTDVMEMHALEPKRIFSILKELDFEVLEVHEDYCVGSPLFISQTFFAHRAPTAAT